MVYKTYITTTNKHHDKLKLQNKKELSQPTLTKGPTNVENWKELRGISSIHPFASDQRQQTKELFKLRIESSSPSKGILFLAFQTIQNKHNGPSLHTFLCFLSTNRPCHPNKVSLTDDGSTQDTQKRAKSNSYKILVFTQWTRISSMDSSSTWHKKHLFAKDHPLFWTWSNVKAFPQVTSQAKKLTLGSTHAFHMFL